MHPFFNNVPAFLVKLWKLVNDGTTDDLVAWNHNGSSFVISDVDKFAKELLPQYFKHNNMASFIRQLNTYGFRKVMNLGKYTNTQECEFQHAFFSRDKIDLLTNIKRKIAAAKVVEAAEPANNFASRDILTNLSSLREKQKVMDTTLTKMKKENELLWRELSTVRQRHKAQEQLLHKVIQFLVQIIQRSNQNIHVPRKLARMLQNSSTSQENSSQVARIVDALRSKDSDCILAPDETASNSIGAVIQEVTDYDSAVATSYKLPTVTKFNTSILKPLPSGSKTNAVPFKSSSDTVSSSLETLNALEHLHKRTTSLDVQMKKEKSAGFPVKFVAVPVQGDPNKLILIPVENFTSQEISNFKEDSFCNVIALPGKESETDVIPISLPKSPEINKTTKNTLTKNKGSELNVLGDVPGISFHSSLQSTSAAPLQGICETFSEMDCEPPQDFDDSVLSDLLQASRISTITENCDKKIDVHKSKKHSLEEDILDLRYLESSNNQLAIPDSSSLFKSTKNISDLSVVQEPSKSNNIDVKYLEQLFSTDDPLNADTFVSKITGDVNMGNQLDDIIGNELVQFIPTVQDDSGDIDLSPWFDFLNPDPCNSDSLLDNNFYCDSDMQIETFDSSFLPSLENVKKETILTVPKKNSFQNIKKTKRRKMK